MKHLYTLLTFVLLASPAAAQTVTLQYSPDDGVTGELIAFEDGMFRLNSLFGEVSVPADEVDCIGNACPEGTALEVTPDTIILTAKDGSAKINGGLIEVTDDQYVLATSAGELRVNIQDVTCEGTGCLEPEQMVFGGEVVLTGNGSTIEGVLVDLSDNAYIVDVASLGIMRISKASFVCGGSGCPSE